MSRPPIKTAPTLPFTPVRLSLLLLTALSQMALAAGIPTLQEVTATASSDLVGVADSSNEGTVTAAQITNRPLLRPAEVLETIPGMVVTQHSGDGKANQYFLRGFNLDHGTDFATWINGMPINVASHAHGQGFMDLNFLIPELVGSMRYRKGVYAAEDGDFSITGSARITYQNKLPTDFFDVSLGGHGFRRALVAGSHDVNGMNLVSAVEAGAYNGPWTQPEHLHRTNAQLRLSSGTTANGFALTAMMYQADWIATEHVPERGFLNGEIDRYGTFAATDGGKTHRYALSGEWARTGENDALRGSVYLMDYGLNYWASPSALLDGQHEQEDQRIIWGGQIAKTLFLGPAWKDSELTFGAQFRQDRADRLGLYQTVDRVRTAPTRVDRMTESELGLYGELKTQWQPWLRSTAALRLDRIQAKVTPLEGANNMSNGGSVSGSQASPKLGLVFGPFASTEYYVNWGRGFHSNDMRGATSRVNATDGSAIDPVKPLVMATGSEVGVRTVLLPGWNSSLTLWKVKMDSELIFIGDEGGVEPKGASNRHGLEWSNYYAPNDWLIVDGDVAVSRARFEVASNGGTEVPNSVPLTASLGIAVDKQGPWSGGLRLRYLGAYPLEETGTEKSTPFWVANLRLGYKISPDLRLSMDVLNLFDKKANDIEYWGASCTRAEGAGCNGGDGINGRLVHPLEPRTFRVSLRANF